MRMSNIAQLLTEHMNIWTAADTEKKSGRGRASGNASSVYGVKKLRELILDLAVRGKLVPQDQNDEPASELLIRIQAEKAKSAEGILKKEKLAPISEDEKLFELPNGWKWAKLNEVADVIRGVTYGKSDASDVPLNDYVPLLRGNNIDRVLNFDKPVYVPRKHLNESQFVKKGDIVIAMSSGSADLVGKAAQAELDFDGGFGAFCGVVRSFSPKLFSYFSYFFQTPYYRNIVAGYGKGIGINNLQKSSLVLLNIPIPPLTEQHRIVAKVDELMALCDQLEQQHNNAQEAHEALVSQLLDTLIQSQNAAEFNANWQRIYASFDVLFTTEASIDALKQTLLQLAVMGKLVPQDPNDEPASQLLKRIKAEKAKLISEGKLKIEKPVAPIGDDEKPFVLPMSWEWVRPEQFSIKITDGEHFRPPTVDKGVYFLSAKDVRDEGVLLDDPLYISEEIAKKALQRCNPEYGDLLIVSRGATVGRMCKVNIRDKFCLLGSVILVKPTSLVLSDYLAISLKSPSAFSSLINASGSTAQPAIYLKDLKEIVLTLPPISEQYRIVTKVDTLMALCDQLKKRIQQSNQQQQAIADVLVAQAVV